MRVIGVINSKRDSRSGTTILEVVVAMFIFIVILTGLMHLLQIGDRVYVRSRNVASASLLALNQVEILRVQALQLALVGDTTYEVWIHGMPFEVERRCIYSKLPTATGNCYCHEYQITVKNKVALSPLVCYRLIQGIQ